MALIKEIYDAGDGWIKVLDNKRPYAIPLCPEGVQDLIRYLKNSVSRKEFYEKNLPILKERSEGRYILKLAIDNSDFAGPLIEKIIDATKHN